MGVKKSRVLIVLLAVCMQYAFGQQPLVEVPLLRFVPDGVPGSQIIETSRGKDVSVYTSGGYIAIHPSDKFSDKFYSHAFLGLIYLAPNKEYVVDILDKKTDALVKSYRIKRPQLIPEIKDYTSASGEFSISANKRIKFSTTERTDFRDLEVIYTLVNLKTRKSRRIVSKNGFSPGALTANTDYQLRSSYRVQQESNRIIYLHVKPYWYQIGSIYVIIGSILGVVLLTITLVLKRKFRSSQREQQQLQQSAIRLQSLLNPHFTFNALSSIQGLMNTGRIEEANNYLQEFSALLRQTLAKSQDIFNSLDQELDTMQLYLGLEALRFNFSWDIIISPTLHPAVIEIPTLLLQPLIENAVKHGLAGLKDKGQLLIICKETPQPDSFLIVVKDNGQWLDPGQDPGYGLSLTKERIQTVNKLRKGQSIELTFDKSNGTEAILTFHNWLN